MAKRRERSISTSTLARSCGKPTFRELLCEGERRAGTHLVSACVCGEEVHARYAERNFWRCVHSGDVQRREVSLGPNIRPHNRRNSPRGREEEAPAGSGGRYRISPRTLCCIYFTRLLAESQRCAPPNKGFRGEKAQRITSTFVRTRH